MEENKKSSWDELSSREKKAITKRMTKWFEMDEDQIKNFYNDKVDNYYEDEGGEPTQENGEEVVEETNQPTETEEVAVEPKEEPNVEPLPQPTEPNEIELLKAQIKSLEELVKTQNAKIDKTYEILEAQGKDDEDYWAKTFGGETKGVREEKADTFGKELFERKRS